MVVASTSAHGPVRPDQRDAADDASGCGPAAAQPLARLPGVGRLGPDPLPVTTTVSAPNDHLGRALHGARLAPGVLRRPRRGAPS